MAIKNPFRSLPARIVFFVFAVTLITSLSVTAVSINSIDSFLREKIEQKFPALLQAADEKLEAWYVLRIREVEVLSESQVLRSNLATLAAATSKRSRERARAEIDQYIRYMLEGFPQFDSLFVMTPTGELLSTVGDARPPDRSDRTMVEATAQAGLSDVRQSGEGFSQLASAPILDEKGRLLATLHARLRLDDLEELLQVPELGPSARIYLIDREGRFLLEPQPDAPWPLYRGPTTSNELNSYANHLGEQVVGTAHPFGRFDWTMLLEQSYGEAFEPVVNALSRVLVINLAIVLAMGLAAFRIAVSIVHPIEALSNAARRITAGETNVLIPDSESSDEVGMLTRAFNAMTMRLTNNANELQTSSLALEEANERLRIQNEELQNVNEMLAQLSITDGLTKLHNHRYFHETLQYESKRAGRSGEPLSLILIDIDYFKRWNDKLGHAAGDEILRRLAAVMSGLVRESDLLARYGGEEFALLVPNTDLEGATRIAEKIRTEVANTSFVLSPPSEQECVTVSIGVATFKGDRRALFNDADRALYRAKASGRDCVIVAGDDEDDEE